MMKLVKKPRLMSITKILWISAGYICVGLAFIGAFLPLMPTTVFLLMAAYAFAKSSPRLHAWLLQHKNFGPLIKNWQKEGAIAKSAKIKAIIVMLLTILLSWVFGVHFIILLIQALVLGLVALFILTRPLPSE